MQRSQQAYTLQRGLLCGMPCGRGEGCQQYQQYQQYQQGREGNSIRKRGTNVQSLFAGTMLLPSWLLCQLIATSGAILCRSWLLLAGQYLMTGLFGVPVAATSSAAHPAAASAAALLRLGRLAQFCVQGASNAS